MISLRIFVCVAFSVRVIQGSSLASTNGDYNAAAAAGRRHDDESRFGIIISPIITWKTIREIAIYWNLSKLEQGDKLILYNGEPGVNGTEAIFTFVPTETRGVHKTKVRANFVPTAELTFRDRCLSLYLVWMNRNGLIQKTTCHATHPNWMSQRRATLGSKRLSEIFIPGTHDSGAYDKRENPKVESVVDKYLITQDEDVLSQLIYGARYLDIRVGRYPNSGNLWRANHGIFSIHPLKTIIEHVKTFLNNTQEIVIFDVQEFPVGFERNAVARHDQLVAYLEEEFADYYLRKTSKGWRMSLDEIWTSGKRLIIGYDKVQIYSRHESTWPAVNQFWPRVKKLDALYTRIGNFENNEPALAFSRRNKNEPSSVMAQLTPETLDAILDVLGGLRKMAELVNINVTESYNSEWRCSANIVSMDFIKSSGIVETALEWNDKRHLFC